MARSAARFSVASALACSIEPRSFLAYEGACQQSILEALSLSATDLLRQRRSAISLCAGFSGRPRWQPTAAASTAAAATTPPAPSPTFSSTRIPPPACSHAQAPRRCC